MRRYASFWAVFIAAMSLIGCADDPCGQGSQLRDGACRVSATGCGAGTELINGECRPSMDRCGDGLVLVAGVCEPEASVCGDGATFDLETRRCVIDAEIVCGENTQLDHDRECVADICGDKTVLDNSGRCVVGAPSCTDGTQLDPNTGRCETDSELCAGHSRYEESTNTCVPTDEMCSRLSRFDSELGLCLPDTCRPGDVLTDGVCVTPAEALAANPDATSAENDDPALGGVATQLELGDPGSAEVVFVGTIEPARDLDDDGRRDQDRDVFAFDAPAGAWVDVAVQSTGIPGAAFIIEGPNGYRRLSRAAAQMATARRIVTPYEGRYRVTVVPYQWAALLHRHVSDEQPLEVFGDEAWSYVATIQRRQPHWLNPRSLPDDGELEVGESHRVALAGNRHAALQYTDPLPTRGDSLQATVFGADSPEGRVIEIGSSDVDVLYGDGPIEHVYFDRVDPEDEDGVFSGRLSAPGELGRLSDQRAYYEASALRNPVFRMEVPARSVVEFGHSISADARFALYRRGSMLVEDAELGEDENIAAVSGESDEVWYVELWESDLQAASWAIAATPQPVTDLGNLVDHSEQTETLAAGCVANAYGVLSTARDTHILGTGWVTDGATTDLDVISSTRHQLGEGRYPRDHYFGAIARGEVIALRTGCSSARSAQPAVKYRIQPRAQTDLGSLTTGSAGWHSLGAIREGETIAVSFEVPADHVIRFAHNIAESPEPDLKLTSAAGEVLIDQDVYGNDVSGEPGSAVAAHAVAGGRYTVEFASDFARQDLQVYLEVTPIADLGTLTPDATANLVFDQTSPRTELQVWRVELTDDAILTFDPIDLDADLDEFEIVSATTGEVEISTGHIPGDRLAIPLEADTWFLRLNTSESLPYQGVGLRFHAASVDMRHMQNPRAAYEPVRWRLPVQCVGVVDGLRLTMRRRDITAPPYVDLVAPDGTRVAIHRDERRSATDRETGYQLPYIVPYESLAPLYGVPAAGDWTLWMYTPNGNIDELYAVGLEVTCAP